MYTFWTHKSTPTATAMAIATTAVRVYDAFEILIVIYMVNLCDFYELWMVSVDVVVVFFIVLLLLQTHHNGICSHYALQAYIHWPKAHIHIDIRVGQSFSRERVYDFRTFGVVLGMFAPWNHRSLSELPFWSYRMHTQKRAQSYIWTWLENHIPFYDFFRSQQIDSA